MPIISKMFKSFVPVLAAVLVVVSTVSLAQAQVFTGLTAGDLSPLILAVSVIGMVSGIYIIISPSRLPSGEVNLGGSFKGLLIIGASLIAVAEIILAVEAFGLLNILPLPLVHDTMMAISLVFIALAIREIGKQKPKTIIEGA